MMFATVSVKISKAPISIDSVVRSVRSIEAGGIVTFVGTVRGESRGKRVTRMELEAATDLAKKDLLRIARGASSKFDTTSISVVHRIGNLRPGDTIVAISVSAAHRREAFAACRHIIDEMKKTTPIWKKEFSGKVGLWAGAEV